jgi:hypothetical protein
MCSQIYFRFSSYLLRKPHLFVILTPIAWFIVNIQSDLFWRATKRKSATENSILKFLTVSPVSSDSIVKGIIDDIIKTAVKTAEVDEQKTKY